MTNQEAVANIKAFMGISNLKNYPDYVETALNMAIEALKAQEPKPDEKDHQEQGETCADAISRHGGR